MCVIYIMGRRIILKNGKFEACEVASYVILETCFDNTTIERTGNLQQTYSGDIFINTGCSYDPEHNKFDHKFIDKDVTFNKKIDEPMCCSGMVYKQYGREFIEKMLFMLFGNDLLDTQFDKIYCDKMYDTLHEHMYNYFFIEIDKRTINNSGCSNINTDISSIVEKMNYVDNNNHEMQMELFKKAAELMKQLIEINITSEVNKTLNLITT